MLAKTAADLEWTALLDQLALRCSSDVAAARARELAPCERHADAVTRVRQVTQARAADDVGSPVPVGPVPALADLLPRLSRSGVATAAELHMLRGLLRTAHSLRRFAGTHRDRWPDLAALVTSDPLLDRSLEALDFALDPDGGIADRASDDLAHARRRAADVRQRLLGRLDELIARYAEVLQDRYYTLRDGRYVLPVRSDSHVRVAGIVLGSSASGATLFIEPRAVTSLGNQLKVAMADVEREEARVLAELSERLSRVVEPLAVAHEACAEADLVVARMRLGQDMRGVSIEPAPEPALKLVAVRHPMLAIRGGLVVPNDLELDGGRVLVISGPNAGGKTVALKCMGLAALMVRTGLQVPAQEGSIVGWFDPIVTDVGDDQSLARSLSTFSAHVTNLAAMIEALGPSSLVLLDELAGGTDPQEGAALAAAILDAFAARGAAVAVTTHYELLKTLALRDERFVNASVGFDRVNMTPTFVVTLGAPGASSALLVAERFGIPASVVARARGFLPEHALASEDALRRIQDEQIAAQLARQAAQDAHAEVERVRSELLSARDAQRAREDRHVSDETQKLLDTLRRARDELRAAFAKVRRKNATELELRSAEREINSVAGVVAVGGALASAVQGASDPEAALRRRPAREDELRAGTRVFVQRFGAYADVIELPAKGQVRVSAGSMKLYVPVEDVRIDLEGQGASRGATTSGGTATPGSAASSSATGGDAVTGAGGAARSNAAAMRTASNTCDVRGLRVDDARSFVDAFIDRMIGAGEAGGFVLHGHGTGALRSAVREHLRESPHVRQSRAADAEDGGDALTVFTVRD